jgi:hypothetical protein
MFQVGFHQFRAVRLCVVKVRASQIRVTKVRAPLVMSMPARGSMTMRPSLRSGMPTATVLTTSAMTDWVFIDAVMVLLSLFYLERREDSRAT